jgi:predicted anti-sigma-YlaC factor YlaD
MTELAGCGDIRQSLGVYVVGAIEPAERVIVDAHLSQCQDCREELAGLAGLPALLGRVPLRDVERLALDNAELRDLEEPPAELLDSLLRRIAARRRARRWRGLVAAAAAAVIGVGGGIGGGLIISHGQGSSLPSHTRQLSELVRGSNPATHVSAAVYYAPRASGTTMQVQVTGVRNGTLCQFWVTTSSGQHVLAGSWTVNGDHDTNWYWASSSVAAAKVRSFDISAGGKVLVTIQAT